MLNIQIDNPELEAHISQYFGNNTEALANAFSEFLQQYRVAQDVRIAVDQLEQGEGIDLKQVIADTRAKYE